MASGGRLFDVAQPATALPRWKNCAAEAATADSARAFDQPVKTYRLEKLVLPQSNANW